MIQAPVHGRLAGLLRWWRSQLTVLDERTLLSGTAATASFTWPVLTFFSLHHARKPVVVGST